MPLFFSEENVQKHLTMTEAIRVLEDAFTIWGTGQAVNHPRERIRLVGGFFHMMVAAIPALGVHGFKAYTAPPMDGDFLIHLYDSATGKLLALLHANTLGQIRTGAATGVATHALARKNSTKIGAIGTGFQAEAQLEAVCVVRGITNARVYSRNPENRIAFSQKMSKRLNIEVTPVESASSCVEGVDIINVITSSRNPVLEAAWLEGGQHINAAGSNHWQRRELEPDVFKRANLITVDALDTAKKECGDLIWAVERGVLRWEQVCELRDVLAQRIPVRREVNDITLFESQGLALEDVAVAYHLYKKAGPDIPQLIY